MASGFPCPSCGELLPWSTIKCRRCNSRVTVDRPLPSPSRKTHPLREALGGLAILVVVLLLALVALVMAWQFVTGDLDLQRDGGSCGFDINGTDC